MIVWMNHNGAPGSAAAGWADHVTPADVNNHIRGCVSVRSLSAAVRVRRDDSALCCWHSVGPGFSDRGQVSIWGCHSPLGKESGRSGGQTDCGGDCQHKCGSVWVSIIRLFSTCTAAFIIHSIEHLPLYKEYFLQLSLSLQCCLLMQYCMLYMQHLFCIICT